MLWFSSEPKQELGAPAPWSFEGSPATSCDPPTWCGAATTLCAGDVETPILCGRSSLVEPGANMDVGVPLWLTEPRDKHPRQEFAISYPAL